MTYGAREELASLQAIRHRTQLILLHKRALPGLERILDELAELSPLALSDPRLLQARLGSDDPVARTRGGGGTTRPGGVLAFG